MHDTVRAQLEKEIATCEGQIADLQRIVKRNAAKGAPVTDSARELATLKTRLGTLRGNLAKLDGTPA